MLRSQQRVRANTDSSVNHTHTHAHTHTEAGSREKNPTSNKEVAKRGRFGALARVLLKPAGQLKRRASGGCATEVSPAANNVNGDSRFLKIKHELEDRGTVEKGPRV